MKVWGIVFKTVSLLGQIGSDPSLKYMKLIHVTKYLLTLDSEMPKRYAKCLTEKPRLSLQRTKMNCSLAERCATFPGLVGVLCELA